MSNRGQIYVCGDASCNTEVEARDLEQARESHDLIEDHEFVEIDPAEDLERHPELFRVVTDGCGRLLAVEGDRVLATVELRGDRDVQTELEDHRQALHELVDRIVEDLVDPLG